MDPIVSKAPILILGNGRYEKRDKINWSASEKGASFEIFLSPYSLK